jgi:predicted nucleic acid-binding protein
MILVDSSVWIDHLRSSDSRLQYLLQRREILAHPAVIVEVALGRARQEQIIIRDLSRLPSATVATDDEVLLLIRRETLAGSGIGYADAHLVASARLTPGTRLWTRDRRMLAVARRLDLDAEIEPYSGLQED